MESAGVRITQKNEQLRVWICVQNDKIKIIVEITTYNMLSTMLLKTYTEV